MPWYTSITFFLCHKHVSTSRRNRLGANPLFVLSTLRYLGVRCVSDKETDSLVRARHMPHFLRSPSYVHSLLLTPSRRIHHSPSPKSQPISPRKPAKAFLKEPGKKKTTARFSHDMSNLCSIK